MAAFERRLRATAHGCLRTVKWFASSLRVRRKLKQGKALGNNRANHQFSHDHVRSPVCLTATLPKPSA
eukprot:15439619-Alexandrium_andersonii.AAC.1